MGGRPRKPIEVKLANKTNNPTRTRREAELIIPPDPNLTDEERAALPVAPDSILTDKGRDLWYRVVVQLRSVGLFFPSVYEYAESYCRAYEVKEDAFKAIKRDGMYVMEGVTATSDGNKRISQEYKVYNEQIDKMVLLGAKLALTPADKSRVSSIVADPTADKNAQKKIGVFG